MGFLQHQLVAEIPALRRYAIMLTRNKECADDLVQDSLERAWKYKKSWKEDSNMRAWLFKIMRNIYLNTKRKEKKSPQIVYIEDTCEPGSSLNSPDVPLNLKALEFCLMQLSFNQREVITLVALEGMSYKDVSRILKLPIGTVMSRLHRAREELRQTLQVENQPTDLRQAK